MIGSVLVSSPARADSACISAYEQAQTLRKDGKPTAAMAQAAICARSDCPALLTKDCTKWLAELEQLSPTVRLEAQTPEGVRPNDVHVTLDGVALTEAIGGKPLHVEPGSRVFVFQAPGAKAVERTVVVKEGDKDKKVVVTLAAAEPRADGRPVPLGVWIFGGVSVVALATSVVFAVDGFSKKGDLDECKPRCAAADVDAMSSSFTVADVALGAGAVAGAAALYLFLTRPHLEGPSGPSRSSSASAAPAPFAAPLRGGGALGVTGRF